MERKVIATSRLDVSMAWRYSDVLIAALLYAVVWWWLGALPGPMQLDFDEGIQVGKGLLVLDGWRIHDEVWSDQPPMMSHFFAWWHRSGLGGPVDPVVEGRRLVALFAVVGLVLVGRLTRKMLEAGGVGVAASRDVLRWAIVAGAIAAVLMLGGRRYGRLGVSAMVGIPAIVLAIASAWVAWGPKNQSDLWRWLRVVGSAALMALALQTKLFVFMLIPATFGLVVWQACVDRRVEGWRKPIAIGLAWLGLIAGFFGLLAEAFGWVTVEQNLAPHMAEVGEDGDALAASVLDNVYRIGQLMLEDGLLITWAVIGLVLAVQQRRWAWMAWPMGWAVVSLIALLFADPLQSHHRLMFTIPAAMLAACGMIGIYQKVMRDRGGHPRRGRAIVGLGGVLAIAALGLAIARPVSLGVGLGRTQGEMLDPAVIAAIQAELAEKQVDWVYMDKLAYACMLNLRTPPELAVISAKRRRNGDLSDELIASKFAALPVDLVLLERFRYKRKGPVMQSLKSNYTLVLETDSTRLFRRNHNAIDQ